MANRNIAKEFIHSLIETGETASILLSGECLATASEMDVQTRQTVLGKIFSLPYNGHEEVGKILGVLDRRDVFEAALEALKELENGHAQRWLLNIKEESESTAVIMRVSELYGRFDAGWRGNELYDVYEVVKSYINVDNIGRFTRESMANVENATWYRSRGTRVAAMRSLRSHKPTSQVFDNRIRTMDDILDGYDALTNAGNIMGLHKVWDMIRSSTQL